MADPASTTFERAPVRFATHMFTGILMFLGVAAGAVVLHFAVKGMEFAGIPTVLILALRVLEYGVFASDVILFGIFLVRGTWRFGRVLITAPVGEP